MHEAVSRMLAKYERRSMDDSLQALREIIQEIALLGLWRSRFFEHAAFYGGTALRILYGIDRFSEDLVFSLLSPDPDFDLKRHTAALSEELSAFGFDLRVEPVLKTAQTAIQSAFLKGDSRQQLLVIEAVEPIISALICSNPYLLRSESMPFLTCLPEKCMHCSAAAGRIVSRGVTGMIWSGTVPTIRSFIWHIWNSACVRAATGSNRIH
jgi:hypothetical protein